MNNIVSARLTLHENFEVLIADPSPIPCATTGLPDPNLQRFEMRLASYFDVSNQVRCASQKPCDRFPADLIMLRVASLDVSFIENVEPGDEALLITRPYLG